MVYTVRSLLGLGSTDDGQATIKASSLVCLQCIASMRTWVSQLEGSLTSQGLSEAVCSHFIDQSRRVGAKSDQERLVDCHS